MLKPIQDRPGSDGLLRVQDPADIMRLLGSFVTQIEGAGPKGITLTADDGRLMRNNRVNLLAMPGHADFSEDTYRTLAQWAPNALPRKATTRTVQPNEDPVTGFEFIPNHGTLRVGDTLTEGIPNFAPEVLRRVVLEDAMRAKQLNRALDDMAEEGVAQVFRPIFGSWPILGAVGTLELDVLVSRLKSEYGVATRLEPAPYETARWITGADANAVQRFVEEHRSSIAEDKNSELVFLAKNAWTLDRTIEESPNIQFLKVRERQ